MRMVRRPAPSLPPSPSSLSPPISPSSLPFRPTCAPSHPPSFALASLSYSCAASLTLLLLLPSPSRPLLPLLPLPSSLAARSPAPQCQKSMARIKQIISERRHAALEAAEILRARGDLEGADRVERSVEEGAEALR